MSPSRARSSALVSLVGATLVHARVADSGLIDDAYISFRYAANWAHGLGLVFNPGERVEGYTNFLWVVLSALVVRLGWEPAAVMPWLGTAALVAMVLSTARLGRLLAEARGRPDPYAGLYAAAVVALFPGLAYHATSGLETTAFALAMTAAGGALVLGRASTFAVATSIAFYIRPEAGMLGLVGTALLARPGDVRSPGAGLVAAAKACAVFVVLVGPYLAFKLVYFGGLAPNTMAAKPPDLAVGARYLLRATPPFFGPLLGAVLGAARAPRRSPERTLLGLALLYFGSVAVTGGDWMPLARLLVPFLGWLALAGDGLVLDGLRGPAPGRSPVRRSVPVLLLGLCLAGVVNTAIAARRMEHNAVAFASRARIGRRLRDEGARVIAAMDIGILGYAVPDATIVDLGGLTDARIGHSPGRLASKEPPIEYLEERAPDVFVVALREPPVAEPGSVSLVLDPIYPVNRYVMASSWFREGYRCTGFEIVPEDYAEGFCWRRPR